MWPFDKALTLALRKRQKTLRYWRKRATSLETQLDDRTFEVQNLSRRVKSQRNRLAKLEKELQRWKAREFVMTHGPHNEKKYGTKGDST